MKIQSYLYSVYVCVKNILVLDTSVKAHYKFFVGKCSFRQMKVVLYSKLLFAVNYYYAMIKLDGFLNDDFVNAENIAFCNSYFRFAIINYLSFRSI